MLHRGNPRGRKTKEEWCAEGWHFYQNGEYQQALAAFDAALQLDPNYALAHLGRGNALYYLRRYDEALSAYEQVIRLDRPPNVASAYHGKGNVLLQKQRYPEALAAYEQAILYAPDLAGAYYGRSLVLLRLRRYEAALDACDQALRRDPANSIFPGDST